MTRACRRCGGAVRGRGCWRCRKSRERALVMAGHKNRARQGTSAADVSPEWRAVVEGRIRRYAARAGKELPLFG